MSNKPFLSKKNHDGVVKECYCLECHLRWKNWLREVRFIREIECFDALCTPFDRLELTEDEDPEDNAYFTEYRCQRYAIDAMLSEFFENKPMADQLLLSTYNALRFLNISKEEIEYANSTCPPTSPLQS